MAFDIALNITESFYPLIYILGDPHSNVYGSVIDGIFDGRIVTGDGEPFFVEKAVKYFASSQNFHSVVYADRNVKRISTHGSRHVKRSFLCK